jgi:hypothetical protein
MNLMFDAGSVQHMAELRRAGNAAAPDVALVQFAGYLGG